MRPARGRFSRSPYRVGDETLEDMSNVYIPDCQHFEISHMRLKVLNAYHTLLDRLGMKSGRGD
ncbi:MAG: hypothetical protein KAT35_00950 [Candidatus Aenigmarchaeota archaeon]|nr:hypothetical protein [Candidatus Aenigmarchaeota archaeon]